MSDIGRKGDGAHMSISNDPYHRPSHRNNYDRELDCFRYADGSRIHRGDLVSDGGEACAVIGLDPARQSVVAMPEAGGGSRRIPVDRVERFGGH